MEPRLFRDSRGNICILNFYPGTIIHFQTHKIPSQINLVTSDAVNSNGDIMLFPAGLYALMVLSSFLPTTALIATVILLVTTYIRRKRAGKAP